MIRVLWACILVISISGCDSDFTTPGIVLVNLGIDPVTTENTNTSYHRSKPSSLAPAVTLPAITIDYSSLPRPDASRPEKAIAYLDVEDDGDLDIFISSGVNLATGDYFDEIYFNDALNTFTYNVTDVLVDYTDPLNPVGPSALNASKALVSDFTGDGLDDIFVLDQANDSDVAIHNDEPKLFIHRTELSDPDDPDSALLHSFDYLIFAQDEGDHTTGAAADIDNDRDVDGDGVVDNPGDIDIFIGGSDPFFYINNGFGSFTRVNNRWDDSMSRVDAAELVDIDEDGYVDLIVGADEANDATSIYWGNSTGTYTSDVRTVLPAHAGYGVILDFEVEHLDGDANKDIVIYRKSTTVADRVIQIIKNNGGRSFAVNSTFTVASTSSAWLRAQDWEGDTDIDIFPDNSAAGFRLENNGSGTFTQIP